MAEGKEDFETLKNASISNMETETGASGEDYSSRIVLTGGGGGSKNGSTGSRETLIVSSDSESREKDENDDDADVEDDDNDDDENGSQSLSDSCGNISDGNNEKEITAELKRTIKLNEKEEEEQKRSKSKAKAVRSLSSQSTSSTTTSTSVGTQNGKKMSSASPCSKDVMKSPEPVRLTGYMEKRSKMLGWKKFWCVLDGRLLTYYKSKSEYESLSACCGSINLGIASTVRPIQIRGCKGYPLQIVTRTQVYYLRSLDKATSDHWLIAIQEAASSNPQISYPVWTDPGTQFYRYSFASLSQWSLNNSTDDISSSSLNRTPQNFYLKNDRAQPLMQKCHSFTSLLSPVVNCVDKMSSSRDDSDSNSSSSFFRRRILGHGSSHDQGPGKVRHSTSMLVLESSQQASDLKKELSRKLSVGSTMSEKPLLKEDKINGGVSGGGEIKDTLSASKVVKDNNLKEDLKEEKVREEEEESGSHHYDEILDFEGANYENYEPCGKEENSGDNDIYEHVETLDDPWEKLDTKKVDLKFVEKRNSGNSQGRGSNRNSLVSISEVPEDLHNSKVKNLSAIPENKTMWKNVSFKNGSNSDEDSSNCSSIQNLSTAEKPGKKWKAIGGFFQKMFHKEKSKKGKDHGKNNTGPMVITGPVDLRSSPQHQQQQQNKEKEKPKKKAQAPKAPPNSLPINQSPSHKNQLPVGSQLAINNENVMDELKKKVGTMKRFDSEGSQSSLSSKSSAFSTPTSETKDFIPSPNVVTNDDIKNHPIIQRKISNESITTIVAENQMCSSSPSDENKSPENKLPESSSSEKISVDPPTQVIRREKNSEEFQLKLARFNRLSQKLSPCFATALNPTPINPVFGHIGRSNSCKIQKNPSEEALPPLPPKKKTQANFVPAIYDVPLNNRPVTALNPDKAEEDNKIPQESSTNDNNNKIDENNEKEIIHQLHRGLCKKNSAPEIFSVSRSSRTSTDSTKSLLRLSLDYAKDPVFEEISNVSSSCPPRPPKSTPSNIVPLIIDEPMSLPTAVFENKENPSAPQENNNSPISSTQEAIIEDIIIKETVVNNNESSCDDENLFDVQNDSSEEEKLNETITIIDESQIIPSGEISLEENAEDHEISKDSLISIATTTSFERSSENSIMLEEIGESDDSLSLTTEQSENSLVVTDETIDSSVTSEKIEILINKTVEKLESISNSKENSNSLILSKFNVEVANDSRKGEDSSSSVYLTTEEHDGSTTTVTTGEFLSVNSKFSPTASNKSVDIDNLEILSDISDMNGDESTSPDSPRSTRTEEQSIPPPPPPPFPISLMYTPSSTPHEYEPLFPVLINETEEVQLKVKKPVDDVDSVLVIQEIPAETTKLKESTSEEPIIEHIYENVKFATIQTIVQELETVEENEDEMSELYDDFPCEFSTPSPKSKYGDSSVDSSPTGLYNMQHHHPAEKNLRVDGDSSIRHSGIDQLQAYLNSDMSANITNNSNNMTDELDFNDDSNHLSVFPPLPPILRTGAVSRLGHSSAINQLQRITENNN